MPGCSLVAILDLKGKVRPPPLLVDSPSSRSRRTTFPFLLALLYLKHLLTLSVPLRTHRPSSPPTPGDYNPSSSRSSNAPTETTSPPLPSSASSPSSSSRKRKGSTSRRASRMAGSTTCTFGTTTCTVRPSFPSLTLYRCVGGGTDE